MTYEISFHAQNTKGEIVGSNSFEITTDVPLNLSKNRSVERFCVEFARLIGISCSFAQTMVSEK